MDTRLKKRSNLGVQRIKGDDEYVSHYSSSPLIRWTLVWPARCTDSPHADPATPSSNRTQLLIQFSWKGVAKMLQTRRRAFTLIELIVVVFIIAIVLAIIFWSLEPVG